jgi:predicted TPR repeat methyltransferase
VILDLGCGTGLLGPELRPIASQLVGVDFSAKMLDEAMKLEVEGGEGKKTYDALVKREAHEYLRESAAEAYDIIIAANTTNFIGELKPLFVQVSQALKEGGLFAFLADIQKDGQDFGFIPSEGRFHFSKSYLLMTATLAGFKLVKIEEAPIYPNEPMWLGIFRK